MIMKTASLILTMLFVFSVSALIGAENEGLKEKRIWNLLRDLKDHEAGRLKLWEEERGKIVVPNGDADYVKIIGIPDDPNTSIDFGVSFPLPKIEKAKIDFLVVEMDFVWPSSQGAIQLTFGSNSSLFSGTGISLSYIGNPGIRLGKLGSSKSSKSFPIPMMGSATHSLKMVLKPNEGIVYAVLDKKVMNATSSAKPTLITLLGEGFDMIEIRRFKMTMVLKKENSEEEKGDE